MVIKTVYVPVKCSERLPDESDFYFTSRGYYLFEDGKWYTEAIRYIEVRDIHYWLEKQEDKYLLTKSQLEEVFNAGRELIESSSIETPFEYESFQDYLKK